MGRGINVKDTIRIYQVYITHVTPQVVRSTLKCSRSRDWS